MLERFDSGRLAPSSGTGFEVPAVVERTPIDGHGAGIGEHRVEIPVNRVLRAVADNGRKDDGSTVRKHWFAIGVDGLARLHTLQPQLAVKQHLRHRSGHTPRRRC
jgi:hypothetical protein